MQQLDIKEIERRAKRALFQNGLIEILFGFYLVMIGGSLSARKPVFLAGIAVLLFAPAFLKALYRRIVYPRVGYAAFGEGRSTRAARLVLIASLVFVVLLAGVFVVSYSLEWWSVWRVWSTRVLPALLGAFLALVPLLQAVAFGVRRGYAVAAISIASGFAVPHLGVEQHYTAICGTQILVIGIATLALGLAGFIGFLRAHPARSAEVCDGVR